MSTVSAVLGKRRRPRFPAPALLALALAAAPAAAQEESGRRLSLEEALALAVPASDAVALAAAEIRRSDGEVRRARAELLPEVVGTAGYTRTLRSQFAPGGTGSGGGAPGCGQFTANPLLPLGERVDSLERVVGCLTTADPFAALGNLPFGRPNQYSFGVQFSQTLLSAALVHRRPRAAMAGRRAARLGLTMAEAQARLDVTRAYFDAVLAERLAAIAELSLAQAESTLAQTTLARRAGTRPEFDLLRARVARDNQRAGAVRRGSERELARLRLLQLIGLPLDTRVAFTTSLDETPPADLPGGAVADPLSPEPAAGERTAIRQVEEAAELQEVLTRVARWERLPTLRLTSRFARIGYPESGLPWNADYLTDWTVGVSLTVPLWTSGRLGGGAMVAGAALDQARLRVAQARDHAALDVRAAVEQLRSAQATWVATDGTVEQARRAWEIAALRYAEGLSTQTELTEARLQLELALAYRATAARDARVARARLDLLPDLPLAQADAGVAPASAPFGGEPSSSSQGPASLPAVNGVVP